MKRTVRLLSLLIAALLVLTACSTAEEAGEATSEPAAPAIPSEPAVEEPTSEPSVTVSETEAATEGDVSGDASGTILELAAENPQLSQLVAAIEAAGLTDALEQAGPLTVFAPDNDAFAQLNQSDLTALLSDPTSLGDILEYHVVEGSYPSSELSDGDTLTTMEGTDLTVNVDGSTITVGGAEVVQADIEAGNGVIHVIDGVLQP